MAAVHAHLPIAVHQAATEELLHFNPFPLFPESGDASGDDGESLASSPAPTDNHHHHHHHCDALPIAAIPIGGRTEAHLRETLLQVIDSGMMKAEQAFFLVDLGSVYRQHKLFLEKLPQVRPFYAVKCNPDPMILQSLSALGTGFDCASRAEIEAILSLNVDPSRIICTFVFFVLAFFWGGGV
jgi:hypothetical protein